jgi:hypothetical protein
LTNADSITNIQPESNPLQQGRGKFSPPLSYNQGHNINLSSVGNLKQGNEKNKVNVFDYDTFIDEKQEYVFQQLISGKGWIYSKKEAGRTENLKKGGREELKRSNLTPYAKRTIRNAGSVMAYLVQNDSRFVSTLMITLTYGKLVPDHKTAKRHLNAFLTRCRKNGWFVYYTWVAQLQTGKRAKEKGLKSYRAEHGAAIHFHILFMTEKGSDLQLKNAQRVLRAYWKKIVNDWEVKTGNQPQNIGGVDVTAVYDASGYVSRYISNEEETIIGNMWGMSSEMRKISEPKKYTKILPISDFENLAKRVDLGRMYRTNAEGKKERVKEASAQTVAVKIYDKSYVICTNNIEVVISELNRLTRNRYKRKIEYEPEELCLL